MYKHYKNILLRKTQILDKEKTVQSMLSSKSSSSSILFILMAQKLLLTITYQNKHLNQQQNCTEYCNTLHPHTCLCSALASQPLNCLTTLPTLQIPVSALLPQGSIQENFFSRVKCRDA